MNSVNFRLRLKEIREAKGIAQKRLADDLGLSQGTVGNWESGTREPNFEMVLRIANYFGVTTDYLLGNDQSAQINRAADVPNNSMDGLPEEDIKKAQDYIDLLKKSRGIK